MTEHSIDRRATRMLVTLAVLAAVYYFGAWLCAALTASAGVEWVQRLATVWHAAGRVRPVILSLLDALGLIIIAIPTVGILARVCPRHRMAWAAIIALPAALPWLWNAWVLSSMGLELQAATRVLLVIDALKTVLIPALLALVVPRFLPLEPAR